ncbi:MAG: carbon starvation protein A [bacterium]|nr:carbon starvation protein A [bacterium]
MITFIIGLFILFLGYIFYSRYTERQFSPDDRNTPAIDNKDGVDYLPMTKNRNCLVQLLNIAGMGPILGAIQGILFGPIAFILIPLGCVLMGGVHDYFAGMISVRNKGMQITELIKIYLGKYSYKIFIIVVAIMLLILSSVFVYTSGDVIADRFFNETNFSITNPLMMWIYGLIALYFILATMFPIDKIIGRFYPYMCGLLIFGTALILIGFFTKGVQLTELDLYNISQHPDNLPLIPMFFMTVSCGLLSGFHATQSTIVSRTLKSEHDGRRVFYEMMCFESLIAMVWAAGAMHVYSNHLTPDNLIGTAAVINDIADVFVPTFLTFVVTLAVVVLPITSGDTALRGLRMIIADAIKLPQAKLKNRMVIIIPIAILMLGVLAWSKIKADSFGLIWRYFTFFNQLIAIPTFLYATVYLYRNKKNYFMTLLPALFFVFITMSFIFNAKIGFNLPFRLSELIACGLVLLTILWIIILCNKKEND